MGLDFSKMKKKRKKKPAEEQAPSAPEAPEEEEEERDYDYYELLDKLYQQLEASGKVSVTTSAKGSKNTTTTNLRLPPIEVVRDGTTKSVWNNFARFTSVMNREEQHLMKFVLAELGTSGSLDGAKRLVIKGRFQQKQLETVIRHYVTEYVKCNQCGGNKSELRREQRLDFVCCNSCGSRRSVGSIQSGYQAKTRYRK